MSVAKIIEITAGSSKSFEDAVATGISRASDSLDEVQGAWIKEQKVKVDEGEGRRVPGHDDGDLPAQGRQEEVAAGAARGHGGRGPRGARRRPGLTGALGFASAAAYPVEERCALPRRRAPGGKAAVISNHLVAMLRDRVRRGAGRTALLDVGAGSPAEWPRLSWAGLGAQVDAVARALVELGVPELGRVAIWSANRMAWTVADLGILSARGTTVPIYASSTSAQAGYLLDEAAIDVLFVGGQTQYDRALALGRARLLVAFDPSVRFGPGPRSLRFEELLALGRRPGARRRGRGAARARHAGGPGDPHLHLGHDRRAARRHAHPRQLRRLLRRARRAPAGDRRCRPLALLPAAGARLRADLDLLRPLPRHDQPLPFRPGAGAGSHGRRAADDPVRRAALLREAPRRHPAQGRRRLARPPPALPLGGGDRRAGRRARTPGTLGSAAPEARPRPCRRARAEEAARGDRRLRPLLPLRRRADLARARGVLRRGRAAHRRTATA